MLYAGRAEAGLRWIKDAAPGAAQLAGAQEAGGAGMSAVGGKEAGAVRTEAADTGSPLGAAHWFALVAALVVGGLFFAARAGDGYTHVAGLLFAGFGLLFGARLLHRLLP